MSLLQESLAISGELGLKPLMKRVDALQERTQPRRPVPAYPDGLTQQEVEVLRLIALGKSNREIAQELPISLRTVGNHVTNILNKTNMANRTGAATYASQHGLIGPGPATSREGGQG
jgi:DNA-binding NarL/FixJ family response regulator